MHKFADFGRLGCGFMLVFGVYLVVPRLDDFWCVLWEFGVLGVGFVGVRYVGSWFLLVLGVWGWWRCGWVVGVWG